MSNLTELRLTAREIFNKALKAVDSYEAVRGAIRPRGSKLISCDTSIDLTTHPEVYSIAFGKAALPMAAAMEEVLGDRLAAGIISTNEMRYTARGSEGVNASPVTSLRHKIFAGGHPKPNEQSLAAAQACFDLLKRSNKERALIFFLISGGGSAMLEWPISEDITLDDLRVANKALVTSGASISEINAVRRAFSAVKGGRLAGLAPGCDQVTLIVSDVPAGQEYDVASGPTLAPPPTELTSQDVVARYGLRSVLPETVLRVIDADQQTAIPASNDSTLLRKHFVLLDNNSGLEAAAQAGRDHGFTVEIAKDISDQSIEFGCAQLLNRLEQVGQWADISKGACVVSGGEFSCPVPGSGIGGRNLESALRLSIEWDEHNRDSRTAPDFVALCAGTDGIDGNSPAAGAIVDSTTIARAGAIGLDSQEFLNRSDSYSFFVALGDAIATGVTGTNVRDLRILLQNRQR